MIRARRRSIYCSPAEWAEIAERARSAGMEQLRLRHRLRTRGGEAGYAAGADGGRAENDVRPGRVPRPLRSGDVRAPAGNRPPHVRRARLSGTCRGAPGDSTPAGDAGVSPDQARVSSTKCRSGSTAQPLRRPTRSSAGVIKSAHVPAYLTSCAMRFRRLKSTIAVTTASRLVLAFVNLITPSSSPSRISTVVFMIGNQLGPDGRSVSGTRVCGRLRAYLLGRPFGSQFLGSLETSRKSPRPLSRSSHPVPILKSVRPRSPGGREDAPPPRR